MSGAAAFALTLAVEVPLYVLGLLALRLAAPVSALALAVGVNALTQPVLWHVLSPHPGVLAVGLGEAAVCLVEAGLVRVVVRRDLAVLLVVSVGANAASVAAGLLACACGGGLSACGGG